MLSACYTACWLSASDTLLACLGTRLSSTACGMRYMSVQSKDTVSACLQCRHGCVLHTMQICPLQSFCGHPTGLDCSQLLMQVLAYVTAKMANLQVCHKLTYCRVYMCCMTRTPRALGNCAELEFSPSFSRPCYQSVVQLGAHDIKLLCTGQ